MYTPQIVMKDEDWKKRKKNMPL